MDDSITSDTSENNTTSIHFADAAHLVSGAVLIILQNVLLLLLTLLHCVASYVYVAIQWLLQYTPILVQVGQWMLYNILSITQYTDDIILSASDMLYQLINNTLDTLENITVKLHTLLPICAALPIQVLRILLDWGKVVLSVLTLLIPSTFYSSPALTYITELNYAISDIFKVSCVVTKSLLEQSSNFLFNFLISLITSTKYITYFTIRVLQISCCQILPAMFQTTVTTVSLVFTKLINIPQQLVFNFLVFLEYYEGELANMKLILYCSVQVITSLFYYTYHYTTQILLFIFQPILSLIEFTIYLLHATFSTLIPGGLVTVLIGLITFWKWYNPTQPHPSPTPPPNTIQFTAPSPPPDPSTPEEELQVQLADEREQKLCVICTDNIKCAVLLPCRHCCLCLECSHKLMKAANSMCPLCRKHIDNVMQIYL